MEGELAYSPMLMLALVCSFGAGDFVLYSRYGEFIQREKKQNGGAVRKMGNRIERRADLSQDAEPSTKTT